MCTLIYATVPARTDLDKLPATAVHLSAAEDSLVASRLEAGEQLCWVDGVPRCIAGGFCGTVLGREARASGPAQEERDAAQAKKLRKKGWSEHKVQTWLAQKQGARRSTQPHLNGHVDELALWTQLLRAALEDAHLRYLGLMVFLSGNEPSLPTRTRSVARSECDLTQLERGVLYRIHR